MVSPVAPIVGNILTLITLLQNLSHQNHSFQGEIDGKFGSLKVEVESAECSMANYKGDDESMLEMQELLLDIQDYLCDLHIPEKLDALFLAATGTDSRPENIRRIDSFLTSIDSVNKRRDERSKEAASKATILPSTASRSKAASTPHAPEKDLEGFTNSKKEFMDLVSLAQGGQLRLISIVGCNGLGKTALARAVYDDVGLRLRSPATPKIPEESDNQPLEEKTAKEIFDCRAWVVASTFNDTEALLNEILKEFRPNAAGANTSKALNDYLADKRYMVVIDDLHSDRIRWKDIKHVFPENNEGNRIIVTTSVHSIARDYSSGCYYVYPMQCLNKANSESLFWKKVFASNTRDPSSPEVERSKIILAKCDGLPLALVSACNYPCRVHKGQQHLCEDRYHGMCHELDNIVASNEIDFDDMKRMFVQCYNNLTDYDHKNCLLYLSIYPRGHEINSKSAVRKLKGEELVAGDALKCWKRLIDNSLIEPAPIRNNCSVAKRCKVQGMMREFTIDKSVSRNLVTLVEEDEVRRIQPDKKVRRLTVRSSYSNEGGSNLIPHEIEREMSTVRSLTVFKSNHPGETYVNEINFRSCKMMRVLDLEGCKGLSSTVVDVICELLFLNYLSLRKTDVNELPTKMKKLERLETLDIRQTRVAILPVEVIMMKDLARLFGEFELPVLPDAEKEVLTNFLKLYSKLHTLAGIVINNTQGFEIIQHAKNLKKVRICGNKDDTFAASAPSGPKFTSFLSKKKNKNTDAAATSAPISPPSVRRDKTPFLLRPFSKAAKPTSKACYINNKLVEQPPPSTRRNGESVAATQRESKKAKISPRVLASLVFSLQKRSTALHSISIDSAGISNSFLASNPKPRITKSIKLRGPLTSLTPGTLKDLRNLRKLHLISTGLSSQKLVEALQSLECLEYLKLGEEDRSGPWNGDFSVQSGGFSALRDLCFEGAKQYPRVKIAQGAMHVLTSLQLLCEKSPPLMGVDGIEHLTCLDEVILHYSADDATVQAWKEAANKHTNKPCVKKQPRADEPIDNAA